MRQCARGQIGCAHRYVRRKRMAVDRGRCRNLGRQVRREIRDLGFGDIGTQAARIARDRSRDCAAEGLGARNRFIARVMYDRRIRGCARHLAHRVIATGSDDDATAPEYRRNCPASAAAGRAGRAEDSAGNIQAAVGEVCHVNGTPDLDAGRIANLHLHGIGADHFAAGKVRFQGGSDVDRGIAVGRHRGVGIDLVKLEIRVGSAIRRQKCDEQWIARDRTPVTSGAAKGDGKRSGAGSSRAIDLQQSAGRMRGADLGAATNQRNIRARHVDRARAVFPCVSPRALKTPRLRRVGSCRLEPACLPLMSGQTAAVNLSIGAAENAAGRIGAAGDRTGLRKGYRARGIARGDRSHNQGNAIERREIDGRRRQAGEGEGLSGGPAQRVDGRKNGRGPGDAVHDRECSDRLLVALRDVVGAAFAVARKRIGRRGSGTSRSE